MPIRTLVVALAAAKAFAELHCVGRLAHEVTVSKREGDWVAVQPAPARDQECLSVLGFGDWDLGRDKHLCVGVNHDDSCASAKSPVVPLPLGTRCQGCFVGAGTDVFYSMNITMFHVESFSLGFRGTKILSTLQVEDDEGKAPGPRKGSKSFLEKPLEFSFKLLHQVVDVKVAMPTSLYYDIQARENVHGDIGAKIEVDIGDSYMEYTKGKGWSHHKSKPEFHLTPIHEGDFDAIANLTVGFTSSLSAELVNFGWFHVNTSSEVPIGVTSDGASGDDLIRNCLDTGLIATVVHESNVDFSIFGLNVTGHWGPEVDHHRHNASRKCKDIHPPLAGGLAVVV